MASRATPHRVVVIGSGFGGLFAAKRLKRAHVEVTLIGQTAHHLFQPLLYQVATGILSPGEIAPPTREILKRHKNTRVLLGEVTGIDLQQRTVTSSALGVTVVSPYDSLIVAAGSGQSYFGNDQFAEHAPGLKSIDDALELRGRIYGAFELAEIETDPAAIDAWLTFVVVGAGPTGVEMAGQLAELARRTLRHEFRHIDPRTARVILVDAVDQVLAQFGDKLSAKTVAHLHGLGVEVQLGAKVVDVDARGIEVQEHDGTRRHIAARTKVWAAGVAASPLGRMLADQAGLQVDRAGRVPVLKDLSLPGHPEVYVIGDMAATGLPGVAQVAMQGAKHVAGQITRRTRGLATGKPFSYFDKGNMATVSRFSAVAAIGPLRLFGFAAWMLWLVIHLVYLIGFKNRVTTLLHWLVSFIGRGRAERTITLQQVEARNVLRREGGSALAAARSSGGGSREAPQRQPA